MSKNEASQSQQSAPEGAAVDPAVAFQIGIDTLARLTKDGIARAEALMDELAKIEAAGYARARATATDLTSLMTESVGYVTELCAEWRKTAMAASRRVRSMVASA
ncbi:MAG TPA: hypothetical protein VFG83_19650 [Kofleriaceae bacterium]|nr:hypothetical protein [Kofleriaceae bacterium]